MHSCIIMVTGTVRFTSPVSQTYILYSKKGGAFCSFAYLIADIVMVTGSLILPFLCWQVKCVKCGTSYAERKLPVLWSSWIATGLNCADVPLFPGREANSAIGDFVGHIFRVGLGSVMSGTVKRLSKRRYWATKMDPDLMAFFNVMFLPIVLRTAESQS